MKYHFFVFTFIFFLNFNSRSQNSELDSLFRLSKTTKDTILIDVYREIALFYEGKNPDSCIKYSYIATKLSLKAKQILRASKNNRRVAYSFEKLGKIDSCLSHLLYSLKLSKEANIQKEEAATYTSIGNIYKNKNDFFESRKNLDLGMKLYFSIKDDEGLAYAFGSLANLYRTMEDYKNSIDYTLKSFQIAEKINNDRLININLLHLGNLNLKLENFESAINYLNKGLDRAKKNKDIYQVALFNSNLAGIYKTKEEFHKSLDLSFEALNGYKTINYPEGIMGSFKTISDIYLEMRKFKEAIQYQDSALPFLSSVNPQLQISYYNSVAYAFILTHNTNKALIALKQAENLSLKYNFLTERKSIYKNYFDLYSITNDYKNALKYSILYNQLKDSLFDMDVKNDLTKKQVTYEFSKKIALDSLKNAEAQKIKDSELALQKENIKNEKLQKYILYVGIILILIFSIFIFNRFQVTNKQKIIIEKQKKEVELQKVIIEEKHHEITDSINYAERIQRSFLATRELLTKHLNDYFILFKPKDIVSGDFYWAGELKNNLFAFATADSTGHGVPGAIMSILNITSLEKATEYLSNPAEILNHTRETIIKRLKNDGSIEGGKDGMDCSLLVFDFNNNKLFIALANNPIWIIRQNELIELKPDKMPVGKHDKQNISFTLQEFSLQQGDTIYTLTDGYPDQFGGEKGKKFMSKNLRDLLLKNVNLPLNQQKDALELAFKNWIGSIEQIDDVTVIGIKI